MSVNTAEIVAGELAIEPDLRELLTIMRRMHLAAETRDWEAVDLLDGLRQDFLFTLSTCPDVSNQYNSAIISEIIDLDRAVLGLASADMSMIANAVSTDC